jgi:radical SAM superfamily enzyme YgiQ (UPF0313 family)
MRVLLITPSSGEKVIMSGDNFFLHEPLALEYVGAGIKGFHDVRHLDMRIDKNLDETLKEFSPDVVGTTGYTIHVNICRGLLKRVKDFNPHILTVIGGHHATISPESFCEKYIDVIVMGEGVYTFKEIVERFERGEDLRTIKGIAIPEDGRLHLTPPRNYTELDDLPFPDRSLTAGYREMYFTSGMKPVASIRTSVGCAYRCSFCALWKITGKRYITRDPKYVIEELSTIKEPYVLFADDETFLNVKRMMSLAGLIKEAGIRKKYQLSVRADTVVRNPELIEKWRSIGLSRARIGFESYLDDELNSFNKKTSTFINEQALRILQERNITVVSQFIVSQDYDRKKFKQLGDYVRRHKMKYMLFSVLTPLPGTIFYESVNEKMISKDYDLYDFKHTLLPTNLPLKDFYREFAKLHMRMLPFWRYIFYRFFFPLTKFIPTFKRGYKVLLAIKNAYKDHEEKTSDFFQ